MWQVSSDQSAAAAMFYPGSRRIWVPLAVFFTLLLALGISGLVVGAGWAVDAVFVVAVAYFGAIGFVAWQQVIRPRPLLCLDELGVEWAKGRVGWGDVERLELVERDGWHDNRYHRLALTLYAGAALSPPRATYVPTWWDVGPVWERLRARFSASHRLRSQASRLVEAPVATWDSREALETASRFRAQHYSSRFSRGIAGRGSTRGS